MEQKRAEAAAVRKPFMIPTVREHEGLTSLTKGALVSGAVEN